MAKIEAVSVFKPNKLESKAQATDTAARAIIEAEAAKRDAKTLRLRAARMKAESEKPDVSAEPRTRQVRTRKR